ncbi:hypothetical protein RM844_28405 [Streptomyces sp. DSM 44915]|uniref:Uncharacterized protein n=1 Tax=Streptomyces chisholmiae TaxID=3075540 RepID=A0ABU2K093_9ACTN|nr:hypothetical protein [Streptomyces sp. DSM 44915]MDT0270199.1 hypothetical protein [Streptomyces sp. DSM 44915]
MADVYTLTLHNNSQQPNFSLAVYTVLPVQGTTSTHPLAWLAKPVNHGNTVIWQWTLQYSVKFMTRGCQNGAVWTESRSLDVSPLSAKQNAALLSYPNGDYDFNLAPDTHPVDPGAVYIDTDARIPPWTPANGPSVGLGILAGEQGHDATPVPAIVGDSGPNLQHSFQLHPTYYIQAGSIVQGTMADLATVTRFQEVVFKDGAHAAEWTLNPDNTWTEGKPQRP